MTDYKEKFEKMRIAGNLAARTLDMLTENIKEAEFKFGYDAATNQVANMYEKGIID